ncbi:response regulator [Streptomyces sp. NPDC051546]|uniref:response regulator n=1 Tax=Streptomyces sp. NPDC051546 TaxID=3365655 RepID=UPI0037BA7AB3
MISLLLADDSQILRQGLRTILETGPGLHVVAEAWDGHSAIEAVHRYRPDVALIDINMSGMDGITATRHILALPHPPRILILTMVGGDGHVEAALQAGAHGFLLKDAEPEQLITAIRTLAAGHSILDPAVTARVIHHYTHQPPPQQNTRADPATAACPDSFSEREEELLRLLGRGHTNAEIAEDLHLSESGVKSQISRLMTRLGVDNRVQLARTAYHHGLHYELVPL